MRIPPSARRRRQAGRQGARTGDARVKARQTGKRPTTRANNGRLTGSLPSPSLRSSLFVNSRHVRDEWQATDGVFSYSPRPGPGLPARYARSGTRALPRAPPTAIGGRGGGETGKGPLARANPRRRRRGAIGTRSHGDSLLPPPPLSLSHSLSLSRRLSPREKRGGGA